MLNLQDGTEVIVTGPLFITVTLSVCFVLLVFQSSVCQWQVMTSQRSSWKMQNALAKKPSRRKKQPVADDEMNQNGLCHWMKSW